MIFRQNNTISILCVLGFVVASSEAFVQHPSLRQLLAPIMTGQTLFGSASDGDTPVYGNIKGAIFDIDGTLADSWKLGFDATQSVLQQNGVEQISEDEYHHGTRYCTPERLARHAGLEPGHEDYEEVGQRLGQEFDELYIGLVSMDTAAFYPGIEDMLRDIPDSIALGALTNAAVDYAHAVFKVNLPNADCGIQMESVHGADDVPAPKPSAEGLWLICKELGVKPEDCVYVGDSPSDAMAAKNAGMPAIGVLWGSHSEESLKQAPFDHLCQSVDELKALLPQGSPVTV